MSDWSKQIGDRLKILLQESVHLAEESGALKKRDLAGVTVDTTVESKNVTLPTDAKLLLTTITKLGELAKKNTVGLRWSYDGAVIGQNKVDGQINRNFLNERLGDQINAGMSAVGYNFRVIFIWMKLILWLITADIIADLMPITASKTAY